MDTKKRQFLHTFTPIKDKNLRLLEELLKQFHQFSISVISVKCLKEWLLRIYKCRYPKMRFNRIFIWSCPALIFKICYYYSLFQYYVSRIAHSIRVTTHPVSLSRIQMELIITLVFYTQRNNRISTPWMNMRYLTPVLEIVTW